MTKTDQYKCQGQESQVKCELPSQTGGGKGSLTERSEVSCLDLGQKGRHWGKIWWTFNEIYGLANVNFLILLIVLWLCKLLTWGAAEYRAYVSYTIFTILLSVLIVQFYSKSEIISK